MASVRSAAAETSRRRTQGRAYWRAQRASWWRAASQAVRPAGPGGGGGGARAGGGGVRVQAQDLAGALGDPAMPLGAEMEPVRVPGPDVLQVAHGPQVDQVTTLAIGDRAQVHVVGGDPAAQQPDDREHPRVEAGEDDAWLQAVCRVATASLNRAARASTSAPRRMSLPPAARPTRSGAWPPRGTLLVRDLTEELAGWPGWRTGGRAGPPPAHRPPGRPSPGTPRRVRVVHAFGEAVP